MSESFEPEVVVLYCGRSLAGDTHLSEGARQGSGFRTKLVMMPCSSKVESLHLVKLIESGADAVVLVACPAENCQFLVGSSHAERRVEHARNLLEEVGMAPDRLTMLRRQELSVEDIMAIARETATLAVPLGQNPMKSG